MQKKVTAQDIAEKLNLSRNTVSKALNNTGIISEDTKNKVIQTAIEMGYKQFSNSNKSYLTDESCTINEIALFTSNLPTGSHFGANFLSGFEKKISDLGIKLSIYVIRQNDLDELKLPSNFNPDLTDGIICIEMFNKDYSNLICNLDIATIFIDSSPIKDNLELNSDILLMENFNSVHKLTNTLIKNNLTNISFVGDKNHCQSFYERWQGYYSALLDNEVSFNMYRDENFTPTSIWPIDNLLAMPKLPDVLICANDFIAITAIKALKKINVSVPEDILICGFDDATEAKIIDPKLTTVAIPSYEMGNIAADLLLSRIRKPSTPFKTTYVKTSIKYRDSTGHINTNL